MSGYSGYSKSNNAIFAEKEGKLPLTSAVKLVSAKTGCTQKISRKVLEEIGPCEWHHTSKRYNITDYYDTTCAINKINAAPDFDKLASIDFENRLNTACRAGEFYECVGKISEETGINADRIICIFYENWEDL